MKVATRAKAPDKVLAMAAVLLLADAVIAALIIYRVPYTKIDWDAYMAQVNGFLAGERNYTNLKGDTGPLVYPAGFLYFYSAIQYLTDGAVLPAQIVFGILYLLNLGVVLSIYCRAKLLPWWALCLLCLSKRVHSIFVLRLFNDCIAMTLAHTAILCFQSNMWKLGMVVFSIAVSVKMNVLLYAPPLLLLMLKAMNLIDVATAILLAALVQVILGSPFLLTYPQEYIFRAFDLGRVFIHFWSVNFKFVPENLFLSKSFALTLLAIHLTLLWLFAQYKWCKHEGGLVPVLKQRLEELGSSFRMMHFKILSQLKGGQVYLEPRHITIVLFTGNFIGVICARSLHYQFYSWYFFSLPCLLWNTPFPTYFRLLLFGAIEACWNIYPSTATSSLVLLTCHLWLLWALWNAPIDLPYVNSNNKVD